MEVTENELVHLAKLCRIACSHEKREALLKDFQRIVSYVDQLSEIDTTGVEPCNYVTAGHAETPLREDIAENSVKKEVFLEITPSKFAGFVRVPTVLNPPKIEGLSCIPCLQKN